MSIIKTIYSLTPVDRSRCANREIVMTITYNGKVYSGIAYCHPDDKDFSSRKVGQRIALSRARLQLLKSERDKVNEEVHWKRRVYTEVTNHNFTTKDGTPKFPELARNYQKAYDRLDRLNCAIKREEKSLKKYLEGLDKAIDSVTRLRNKGKSN